MRIFFENKISAERAEQILGDDWKLIIENITRQLAKEFESKSLIYKTGHYTGSITLGWKFEFVNKKKWNVIRENFVNTRAMF